jgi:hypothetical protein
MTRASSENATGADNQQERPVIGFPDRRNPQRPYAGHAQREEMVRSAWRHAANKDA